MPQQSIEPETEVQFSNPEKDLTKKQWGRVHLEHYLVIHTKEYAAEIADLLNRSKPEIIFIECVANLEQKNSLEDFYQAVIDGDIVWEEYKNHRTTQNPSYIHQIKLLEDNWIFALIQGLDFPTTIKLVDITREQIEQDSTFASYKQISMAEETFDKAYEKLTYEAEAIAVRDNIVEAQVAENLATKILLTDEDQTISAALVTGTLHMGVTRKLRQRGLKVRRQYVNDLSDEDKLTRGERVRFDAYEIALREFIYKGDKGDSQNTQIEYARAYVGFHMHVFNIEKDMRIIAKKVKEMSEEELQEEIQKIDKIKKEQQMAMRSIDNIIKEAIQSEVAQRPDEQKIHKNKSKLGRLAAKAFGYKR